MKKLNHTRFTGWDLNLEGFLKNKNGEWLLICQIFILIAHLLPKWPRFISLNLFDNSFILFIGSVPFLWGIVLAFKSLYDLGNSLSPLPEPKINAKFIKKGVYKNCRHPLYRALLLCSFGISLWNRSLLHLILLGLLIIVLVRKAKYEEKKLLKIHSEYKHYMYTTPAISGMIFFLDWHK